MLQELAMTSQAFVATIGQYGVDVLLCVLAAWCIHCFNVACQYRLNILGIYPRRLFGLIGIVTSPWLHGNWGHLISNTLMFILMSLFMLMQGMVVYVLITILIILMTGVLVWLFARRALHIGASGLIMGYFGFLVVAAIAHPGIANIAVTMVCLYYFGGMFMNLFPTDRRVSWEGHVFGFISGVIVAFIYPAVGIWVSGWLS